MIPASVITTTKGISIEQAVPQSPGLALPMSPIHEQLANDWKQEQVMCYFVAL